MIDPQIKNPQSKLFSIGPFLFETEPTNTFCSKFCSTIISIVNMAPEKQEEKHKSNNSVPLKLNRSVDRSNFFHEIPNQGYPGLIKRKTLPL